jgi:hypothetical protein
MQPRSTVQWPRAAAPAQSAPSSAVPAPNAGPQDPARSAAVRQLIARSVLHGPALRSLLAAGR